MCTVCVVPSSSSGAMRLAAKLNTALIMFVDPSTASFTTFTGSELNLLRPPVGVKKSTRQKATILVGWLSHHITAGKGNPSSSLTTPGGIQT